MDIAALIDAVVRQTTVLVAQLATTGGSRARLAHTADQVFMDLVATLKDQGLGNKVIADMFGLALRTYHAKVQRLAESRTIRGQSLWSALLEHVERRGPLYRTDVLARFSYDDPISVRGVLKDLVDGGMIYSTGSGDHVQYRVAEPVAEKPGAHGPAAEQRLDTLVWITVHRMAKVTPLQIATALSLDAERVEPALLRLVNDGRIRALPGEGARDTVLYTSDACVLPLGDPIGWEAAVFDHYQAVVGALCNKLSAGTTRARHDDLIGGSTYSFDLTQEHPFFAEVTKFLAEFRTRGSALRQRVADYNRDHPSDEASWLRVVHYAGQNVIGPIETEE
jgi:GNAT superfamily N-acetyltransferase